MVRCSMPHWRARRGDVRRSIRCCAASTSRPSARCPRAARLEARPGEPKTHREETMDQRTRPAPRLAPLAPETTPELGEQFDAMAERMGFIPNSVLIMQRNPKIVRAFVQMAEAIWSPNSGVD